MHLFAYGALVDARRAPNLVTSSAETDAVRANVVFTVLAAIPLVLLDSALALVALQAEPLIERDIGAAGVVSG